MGLKSKLNKMKSFLFDDEEESVKKPKVAIKKDSKKEIEKEIEEKKLPKTQDIEELYFEDVSEVKEESGEIKSRVQKKEAEFKFPQFDDDDFAVGFSSAFIGSGQYSVCSNADSAGSRAGRKWRRHYASLVGYLVGSMPGRQWYADRRVRECGSFGYQQ